MPRLLIPLAAGAFALAGCAAVPKLGPAPRPATAAQYASVRSFAAPAAAWPADRWWTAYGDPQLDDLMAEALAGSPSLAEAAARLRTAEARAEQARGATLPSVSANGQAAEGKQSYNNGIPAQFVPKGYNDTGRLSLDLAYDLDLWGRNRAALAAAVSEADAARMDAAEARLALTTAIASAYADFARLNAERAAAAQARSELAALDEQLAVAKNRLAALTGAGPDRGLSLSPPKAQPRSAFGLPPNLAADLLGRRPDLQAARLRAEAAARRIDVARAGFSPNVNLAAFIGVQALGLDNLTASGSDIGQVGAAVSLPIFSAGRLEGAYRGARADYDAALVRALQEVADAAAGERALEARLTAARESLASGEEAYRIARLRYEGGLTSYLTLLTAEDAVIAQRRLVAQLEARALALDAQLVRALGGGFRA
jgi:outer membrane protein TolC